MPPLGGFKSNSQQHGKQYCGKISNLNKIDHLLCEIAPIPQSFLSCRLSFNPLLNNPES